MKVITTIIHYISKISRYFKAMILQILKSFYMYKYLDILAYF